MNGHSSTFNCHTIGTRVKCYWNKNREKKNENPFWFLKLRSSIHFEWKSMQLHVDCQLSCDWKCQCLSFETIIALTWKKTRCLHTKPDKASHFSMDIIIDWQMNKIDRIWNLSSQASHNSLNLLISPWIRECDWCRFVCYGQTHRYYI